MKLCLLGALWGDICGVPYEFHPQRDAKKLDLNHLEQTFSDDTVLTLAVAKAILEKRPYRDTIFDRTRTNESGHEEDSKSGRQAGAGLGIGCPIMGPS